MCGSDAGCAGCPIGTDFYVADSLADLEVGERAVVQRLHADRGPALRKLLALGLLPGVEIEVEHRWPALVLAVDHTTIAIDASLAELVLVRRVALQPHTVSPSSSGRRS
jgi:Fe2+ transport system protein FeoA